jgi:hypothetical protein
LASSKFKPFLSWSGLEQRQLSPARATLLVVKNFFICSSDEFASIVFRLGPNREAGPGLMPFFLTALFAGLDAAALKRDARRELEKHWSDEERSGEI